MTYEDFISRFQKTKKTSRGVMCQCPSHDDSPAAPSLSVGRSNDGGVLLKCFAGCSSEQVVSAMGLKMSDLFAKSAASPLTRAPVFRPAPVAAKVVQPESELKLEATYQYRDIFGNEAYQVLRFTPKTFRQRRKDSAGRWIMNMDGVERVLYHLPEVLAASEVFVVEGEKDADNLRALGFCATTNVGGGKKWMDGYSDSLAGRDVVLCGDNDETGRAHVKLVFDSISCHAKTVKIIKVPEPFKDVSDYIESTTKEAATAEIRRLADEAHSHIKGHHLPIRRLSAMESRYKQFVSALAENSFSLGKWLPSLGKLRRLVPGELVFILGQTGLGKTGILQAIAESAMPLPTLMFELELPDELMFERYVAMATKMTCQQIEDNYAAAAASRQDESLSEMLDKHFSNLFICTESKLTLKDIESHIVRAELVMGVRPKLVLIDYIQLIQGSGSSRREKVGDIAEGLKVLAKSTGTIIIVTSQISRNREESEPSLFSAKESGEIENSCGLLLGAWRDESGGMKLRVLKSTKGGAGMTVDCNFDGARMRITERSRIPDDVVSYRSKNSPSEDS